MRIVGGLLLFLLTVSAPAAAEGQIKPFLGVTFGGGTNLLGDLDHAVGKRKTAVGISTVVLGEVVGFELDLGRTPAFFQSGGKLVLSGSMTTLTGNVVVALPRRMSEYTLRPYLVGGGGLMHTRTTSFGSLFELSGNDATIDAGAGVTGYVTPNVGVSWDVRHFRTVQGKTGKSTTIDSGAEKISFWRAYMALAIRY